MLNSMHQYPKKRMVIAGWSLLLLIALMGSCWPIGTVNAAEVDESTPIGMKWVKLGGMAEVGAPTSDVLMTSNGAAQYQKFEKGVIVYSNDWGAVLNSKAIFDKWQSQGQNTADGQNLFNYIGVPNKDFTVSANSETGSFERGMIIVSPEAATAFAIYGEIYLHYWDVKNEVGLPTSDEATIAGGRYQTFENGDIYWKQNIGAEGVQEAVRLA